jgi:hypothetical protein
MNDCSNGLRDLVSPFSLSPLKSSGKFNRRPMLISLSMRLSMSIGLLADFASTYSATTRSRHHSL